ncbi:acylphosphatase [Rhizobium bangladeshense]|uniref:Acylphosphatase n=1 Tax=Rhizobium bangladeshense TaxID=1138189 RepID=A0ABS7LQH9_9HYPH|nr:acylphosphatase [Rhizobium bangladeshense]MBX4892393.1 acylphosphatase [Rhizobium bangladeshense]MBX4898059.1 acylphosphatase [Rhizobium bangladeshense]MBX4902079.1 acylphosphatase [Rhizobium bangladeshense]MBX4913131.1 acylphosphatase [Rhizobium bangladeshense]MBX4922717.1 acylphosphatase [Rhizobium bangladeshense]
MSDHYKAVRVRISGRVQGVGFRMWTRGEASRLGVTGWVRNEADGSVAALVAGSDSAISTMIERLRSGPAGASVSGVETEAVRLEQMPAEFRITG